MDQKTKNLLPNLLYLKTLMEREIHFREMFTEFLCGLYMMETRLPGGNMTRGHRHSGEPYTPAEKNVKNSEESTVNGNTSPGDCLQINSGWFFQGQDFNFLMIHMGQGSNILYIILLNDD